MAVQAAIYKHLHWIYTLLVTFFLLFQLILAFSKMGDIRLGADNSEPQYGFFSWIAMLFAAGMGIGLMYYGVAEPMSHYVEPALPAATDNPAKGRTIREYILAVLFVPSMFIFLWMTVFGNGAIWLDQHQAAGALSALAGNADVLLFAFFEQFPLATPLSVLALLMVVVFFITSADSGILVMNSIASGNKPNTPQWQNIFWGSLLAIISIALLSAGGIKSLQTMTLITALPFGIIMLILCFCLFKALHTDELYNDSKIPYGSRAWDGRHWRERLQQVLTFSQKQDIQRFFEEKVRPAFEELKEELSKNGIDAFIQEGRKRKFSVELNIPSEQLSSFRYGVVAEKRVVSDYLVEDDNTPDVETGFQYIPVTYYSDGRTGNDIQYLSREEIIADVMREYERYLSIIADDKKSMVFIDKNGL